MSENLNQETNNESNNQELLAGKYKSVQELSNAYESLQQKYSKTSDEKKQLEDKYKAPSEYSVLAEHALSDNELNNLKEEAKTAQLTQDQFNTLIKKKSDEAKDRTIKAQKIREELGEDTINVLKDYVAKNYPPAIGKEMLEKVILDPALRAEAFQHRDRVLNNSGYGIGNTTDIYARVTKSELEDMAIKVEKNPADLDLLNLYLKKTKIYATQNKKP